MSDEMYFQFGVDEEEFNFAMMHYNLMNDPEIKGLMMANLQKVGVAGGGAGGMFGQ